MEDSVNYEQQTNAARKFELACRPLIRNVHRQCELAGIDNAVLFVVDYRDEFGIKVAITLGGARKPESQSSGTCVVFRYEDAQKNIAELFPGLTGLDEAMASGDIPVVVVTAGCALIMATPRIDENEIAHAKRDAMLINSLEEIRAAYNAMSAAGVVQPVVFVVDTADSKGREFAGLVDRSGDLEGELAAHAGGAIPGSRVVQCLGLSYEYAKPIAQVVFGEFSEPAGEGDILVLVATAGSGTTFRVPAGP